MEVKDSPKAAVQNGVAKPPAEMIGINDVVWRELRTTDPEKASEFYSALFGWKIEKMPFAGADYWLIKAGEPMIGGFSKVGADERKANGWVIYFQVETVEDGIKAWEAAGGTIIDKTPKEGGDGSRFVEALDQGGEFSLLYQSSKKEFPLPQGPGTFCWSERNTDDMARDMKFFTTVFGWDASTTEPKGSEPAYPHLMSKGKKRPFGGMFTLTPEMKEGGVKSSWLQYVEVEDCDASTKKAVELGGKVCKAPFDIPGTGRIAILLDPLNACFALYQSAQQQKRTHEATTPGSPASPHVHKRQKST